MKKILFILFGLGILSESSNAREACLNCHWPVGKCGVPAGVKACPNGGVRWTDKSCAEIYASPVPDWTEQQKNELFEKSECRYMD